MKYTEPPILVKSTKSEDLDIDFQQYWFILKRRWLPAISVLGAILLLVAVVVSRRKPSYTAEGKLLIKRDETSTLTGLGKESKQELTPLKMQGNPLDTEAEILLSKPLLKKTITELGLKDKKGKPLDEEGLKKDLKVENVGGTDILQLSYISRDPKEVAAVVNKLMNLYIQNNVLVNQADVLTARQFIYKQLPEIETTVRNAEAELRKFREVNQIVSLEEERKKSVEEVEDIKSQLAEFKTQMDGATAESTSLMKKLGMASSDQAIAISRLSQTPAVQTVLTELQTVENQLSVEQARFLDDSPGIIALKSKQASLQALLQERIKQELSTQQIVPERDFQAGELELKLIEKLITSEQERLSSSAKIASLSNIQASYRQRLNILPRLEQDERELERRVDAAQSTYKTLLTKIQELQAAENQAIGNARIIENASVPKKPSADKAAIALPIGGILVGVLLAGVVILILEIRDSSIKTVKAAKKLFGYTLLGAIPSFERSKKVGLADLGSEEFALKIPVRDTPGLPISEVYRMIQANLEFLGTDKAPKVIVVASSVSKEGKSTVAANLAVAVAELKQQVLLVDADMRHPFQHHAWELTNEVGLSNVIAGQAKLQLAVKEVMPNLDVLTSGVMPPSPVMLLKSKGMISLIDYASKNYDFVIIDAPPLVLASDALILGKMTDGILLVARPKVVDYTSAAFAKELLEQSNQNVLGLVVNGVILENESDSYFHHTKRYSATEGYLTSKNPSLRQ
jgi:capsular exopolysaccharide synthesis family protein